MAPKRKLKQISNYDENSNGSFKSNSNERKKLKNKRMKRQKTDTTEDPKIEFESNRKKIQLPSRGQKSDKYVFDNSHIDDFDEEIIDTTQKSRTNIKRYSSQTMSC